MDTTPHAHIANSPGASAAPASPAGPAPAPKRARPRQVGAGHVVAIIVGVLLLFPGLGLFGGGALALTGQAVATDDDGYFEFTLDRLATDGVALAATDVRIDGDAEATDWLLDWLDVDVRLRVDGARSTDEVFVGIARTADVERYLAGTGYTEIVEVNGRTPVYLNVSGDDLIDAPLDQDFWTASTSGTDVQELTWEARAGRWSVVVMNADGSRDVAADVEVGAKTGALTPVAVTLLVVGGVMLVTAVALIVAGARGRRVPETPTAAAADPIDPHGDGGPLAPPAAGSAAHLADDEHVPVGV